MASFRKMICLASILIMTQGLVSAQVINGTGKNRIRKDISLFQIVRFPNVGCAGSGDLNGTCYTRSECANKGGSTDGSCASGYGVCCIFTLGCGSNSTQNSTYFLSRNIPSFGSCGVTICKCSPDICQLRIDMTTFVISGPHTVTTGTFYNSQGVRTSLVTNCLTDNFSVTSRGTTPPSICGINSGYHMYVDSSDLCNNITFQLGTTGIGAAIATRTWNLKISQISCYDANQAPQSCTQYFYGVTGTLNSFNWPGGYQLSSQIQTICVRREQGHCKICYSPTTTSDFGISGKTKTGIIGTGCCNYSIAALLTYRWDCLLIPGAAKTTGKLLLNNFCGGKLITATKAPFTGKAQKTVCSTLQPFMIQFQTDIYSASLDPPAVVSLKGFNLVYWQTAC